MTGPVERALDLLVAHLVGEAFAAIRASSERDYIGRDDVAAICEAVQGLLRDFRRAPPVSDRDLGELVMATCHRAGVPVVP